MCVLSQRFTAGDLSLSLLLPPKVSPLQERGLSIFVTFVGVLLFVSVTVTSVTSETVCYIYMGARGTRGYVFAGFKTIANMGFYSSSRTAKTSLLHSLISLNALLTLSISTLGLTSVHLSQSANLSLSSSDI